jgi:hypothetical protein
MISQDIVTWRFICKILDYAFKSEGSIESVLTQKHVFINFFGIILGFIISKVGKLPDPKKI